MAEVDEYGNRLLGVAAGAGGAVGRAVGDLFDAERGLAKFVGGAQASGQKFEVNRDNVLQAAKIIQDQAEALDDKNLNAFDKLRVSLADDINGPIAAAWNSRLVDGDDSYSGRIAQYVVALQSLVDQLREAAKQYGFTEEEITASLGVKQ